MPVEWVNYWSQYYLIQTKGTSFVITFMLTRYFGQLSRLYYLRYAIRQDCTISDEILC